jgi:hypothetical protein
MSAMIRSTFTLLAAALVLGSAAGAATPAPNVVGVLVRPVMTVTCDPSEPCDPPATAIGLAFSRNGRVVARVRVGATNRFALHLAPGRYAVRAVPPLGTLTPTAFRVPQFGLLHLRLQIR